MKKCLIIDLIEQNKMYILYLNPIKFNVNLKKKSIMKFEIDVTIILINGNILTIQETVIFKCTVLEKLIKILKRIQLLYF